MATYRQILQDALYNALNRLEVLDKIQRINVGHNVQITHMEIKQEIEAVWYFVPLLVVLYGLVKLLSIYV